MTEVREDDFSERQNYPFMVGAYLAVNAISDAFLLVDGPDCAHMKTQYVQGNHDWLSTLTDISGFQKVMAADRGRLDLFCGLAERYAPF